MTDTKVEDPEFASTAISVGKKVAVASTIVVGGAVAVVAYSVVAGQFQGIRHRRKAKKEAKNEKS